MNRSKFRDLATGAHFRYRGRAYIKLEPGVARNGQRARIFFPSDMVVEPNLDAAQYSKTIASAGQTRPRA